MPAPARAKKPAIEAPSLEERIRRRAYELYVEHDDIGSSLTHIAVLSEVARKEINEHLGSAASSLEPIATLSRELIRFDGRDRVGH